MAMWRGCEVYSGERLEKVRGNVEADLDAYFCVANGGISSMPVIVVGGSDIEALVR